MYIFYTLLIRKFLCCSGSTAYGYTLECMKISDKPLAESSLNSSGILLHPVMVVFSHGPWVVLARAHPVPLSVEQIK